MLGNIVFNYGAQVFLALAGIVTLPFLLAKMGPELYAFVGISFTIQTIFAALDGGMSGALAREFAVKRSSQSSQLSSSLLLRKIEPLFLGLTCVGVLFSFSTSKFIAEHWLKTSEISVGHAHHFLLLIGIAASIRLAGGLYRSALIGYEFQKLLSCINIGTTASRYYIVLLFIEDPSNAGFVYFYFQVGVSILELMTLAFFARRAVKNSYDHVDESPTFLSELKLIVGKSFQIWTLTLIWIASNQLDKVLLSGTIPLVDYGYFSVVATLAAGVLMLGSPVTSAAMPRIALLYNDGMYVECKQVYLKVSRLLSTIALPVGLTLAIGSEHILFLMTKNLDAAVKYSPILAGYACGSIMLLFAGLTFLLQYASGNLRSHLRLNFVYFAFLAPSMVLGVHFFSAGGAAWTWLGINTFWTAVAVRPLNRLANFNVHYEWLGSTIVTPIVYCVPSLVVLAYLTPSPASRLQSFFVLAACYILLAAPLFVRLRLARVRATTMEPHER